MTTRGPSPGPGEEQAESAEFSSQGVRDDKCVTVLCASVL